MSLLDIYKERNNDKEWFDQFFSLGKNKSGRLFAYTNTNFRKQDSFFVQFDKFEKVENMDRNSWGTVDSTGQEADKQRVVNMIDSKLFMRELVGERKDKNFIYHKTEKGKVYRQFLNAAFPESESWFLNYIFLLNGHYANMERHILERTNSISKNISNVFPDSDKLVKDIEEVITKPHDKYQLIRKNIFYLISFYDDPRFLELYLHSNDHEKKELQDYIIQNLKAENDLCCISRKYKNGGNYTASMFNDEVKVFYLTFTLERIKSNDIGDLINRLLVQYIYLYNDADAYKINDFVHRDSVFSVFSIIFSDILDIREEIAEEAQAPVNNIEVEEVSPQSYIDDTTIEGRRIAKQAFALKKRRAREIANHKCSLEKLNNCRYFTSKASNLPYIEVHHFIPQEFRNEFANSIEVFANYTTLCPYCHEMLHKAVDNERKPLINYLYNERSGKLEAMGLGVDIDKLYEFYRMDS
jgi:hypothetical protein